MTKSGVTHTNTSNGDGRGQLTESPNRPSPEGGTQPQAETPAPSSGSKYERQDDKDHGSGKSDKGDPQNGKSRDFIQGAGMGGTKAQDHADRRGKAGQGMVDDRGPIEGRTDTPSQ